MSILDDPRVTAVPGGGYEVTCCPGLDSAPTARVEPWACGEWEAFYLTGQPERTMFDSAEAAIEHLLEETR